MVEKSKAHSQNPRNDLSAAFVNKILRYEPSTGKLFWRARSDVKKPTSWAKQFAGKEAGHFDKKMKYVRVSIGGHSYLAHRLIWLMRTGKWPMPEADHKDRNGRNNKWRNLRESTRGQNNANRRAQSRSGFKGVTFHKRIKKWMAQIGRGDGKSPFIGYFNTPKEAHRAYCKEAKKRHKKFFHAG